MCGKAYRIGLHSPHDRPLCYGGIIMLLETSQSGADRASSLLASNIVSWLTTPQRGTLCMFGIQTCTITALRLMYRMYRIQEVDHVGKRSMEPHLSFLVLLRTPFFLREPVRSHLDRAIWLFPIIAPVLARTSERRPRTPVQHPQACRSQIIVIAAVCSFKSLSS